jgi:hypothetical protein
MVKYVTGREEITNAAVNNFWSKLLGVAVTAMASLICLVIDEVTKEG